LNSPMNIRAAATLVAVTLSLCTGLRAHGQTPASAREQASAAESGSSAHFEIADVHASPPRPDGRPGVLEGGGPVRGGRLEVTSIRAQSPTPARPQFEVASIKITKFSPGLMGVKFLPGGQMRVDQSPLILLIAAAYSIPRERVEFPTSLHAVDEFYNIDARASSSAIAPGTPDREARRQTALMLQSLLEERFKLRFHREAKERPALALFVGKSGPRFPKAADRDCAETLSAPSPCHVFPGGPARGAAGKTVTLSDLAGYLSLFMGQLVVDRTGLSGTFDIDLPPWSRGTETGQRAADDGREPVSDASSPSIFAVMQDLGLRLESSKARVDVLVIDHVEKPTEN
jgi:uncharacterized protein (TIGR03435 family)